MAKSKNQPAETLPARIDEEFLPDWSIGEDTEVQPYSGEWEGADGSGLPFVGIRNEKTGSSGGVAGADALVSAGVGLGEPYAFGGSIETPRRLANVPLLLLRRHGIAYREGENFKAVDIRRVDSQRDAAPDEETALDALLLVLDPAGAFLATYRERLREAIGYRSTILVPWADRIAAAPVDAIPVAWARVAGRLYTDPPKKAKKPAADGKTYSYRRERISLGPLAVAEVQQLATWLRSEAGRASGAVVDAFESRYRNAAPAEGRPAESDEEVPF